MKIKRDKYLNELVIRMNNGMIKVITGIRRSGKSYLLFELFYEYLIQNGVPEENIIPIALDDYRNREYRDPDAILRYILNRIGNKKGYYVFLDEVQLLKDFEEVLITLLHVSGVDVYVTGSNSRFLSKDIITEFRGRGDEVHIYPLSFAEFMSVRDGDVYRGWDEYITYGGLPALCAMKTEEQKIHYLENLFRETYLKDIIERHGIKKTQEFEDLLDILASCIGSPINPPKIESTFKSKLRSSISVNTIRQFIDHLEESYLISEAKRYDVKGRKYIGAQSKYYFEDVGLRNVRLNFRQIEQTHLMENILYNELRLRGYNVDVGIIDTRDNTGRLRLEIDFVANMGSERCYIQSAFRMPDAEKVLQEKRSLNKTGDSFRKLIITQDQVGHHVDSEGIVIMGLFDFLLDKDSSMLSGF